MVVYVGHFQAEYKIEDKEVLSQRNAIKEHKKGINGPKSSSTPTASLQHNSELAPVLYKSIKAYDLILSTEYALLPNSFSFESDCHLMSVL